MTIYEGTVITCDAQNTVASYLVEHKGIIQFTGDELPEAYRNQNRVQLGDTVLIPSFTDSHLHFSSYALFSSTLDVRDARSFEEVGALIQEYQAKSRVKLVLGFGISAHHVQEERMISRSDLDQLVGDLPVMLIKYDGHASVVNSAMLKMLPARIHKLAGFQPDTGAFMHQAFYSATDYISSKVSIFSLLQYMLTAMDKLSDQGIGLIHPAEGVGFPLDLDVDLIRFLAGGLINPIPFRIFFQTLDVKKALKRRLPRIGGCFATALDGCLGSMDAALIQPYKSDPANRGILVYSDEQLFDFVQNAHDKGLQVQLHAIGDDAFDQATRAFEHALSNNNRKDHRHSIIHASLITPRGLERCAKYQIGIAAQPALLHQKLEPLPYIEKILGSRAYEVSPFRTMLNMGIHVSGGSDAPVTLPDPLFGIYAACNHYNPDQSISVPEAIKMFTYETAWAGFDEKETGSLEKGKRADFVVLDQNPLTIDARNLNNLKIKDFYLSGQKVKKKQTLSSLLFRSLFNRRKNC